MVKVPGSVIPVCLWVTTYTIKKIWPAISTKIWIDRILTTNVLMHKNIKTTLVWMMYKCQVIWIYQNKSQLYWWWLEGKDLSGWGKHKDPVVYCQFPNVGISLSVCGTWLMSLYTFGILYQRVAKFVTSWNSTRKGNFCSCHMQPAHVITTYR